MTTESEYHEGQAVRVAYYGHGPWRLGRIVRRCFNPGLWFINVDGTPDSFAEFEMRPVVEQNEVVKQ